MTDTLPAQSGHNWPGRHFHVDQILDRPGPRTDESCPTGDEVGIFNVWVTRALNATDTASSLR